MSEVQKKATPPRGLKKIIRELAGSYRDDVSSDTLKKWEAHALLLHDKGLTIEEIEKTLNDLFWSVAGEFGA